VIAWQGWDAANPCSAQQNPCKLIQARARAADGTLGAVQTLSDPGQHAHEHRLAVDPNGDAVVVWRRGDGTTDCDGHQCQRIQTRTRLASGVLTPVRTLSVQGQQAGQPTVGVDSGGNAVFGWEREDGTTDCGSGPCQRVQARTLSAAGALSSVQTLSAAGQDADEPWVGVDAAGNAAFVWGRDDGTTQCGGFPCERIQARSRSAAGALTAVQTLSAGGQPATWPRVAVDPDGGLDPNLADAAAVWQRFDGSASFCCDRIQAAAQIAPPPF
jgi:hypothetical protein